MRVFRSSRVSTTLIVSIPVLLGILELGHPPLLPGAEIYETIAPVVRWWTVLHVLQLPLLALLGGCVVLLTLNSRGRTVMVARWAMAVFAVAYPAYDATVGIASGVMVANAGRLTADAQVAMESGFQALFWGPVTGIVYFTGALAWLVGMGATAIAVYKQGAHWIAVALIALSAVSLSVSHVRPFGPLACFSFAIGAALVQLSAKHKVHVQVRKGIVASPSRKRIHWS